MSKRIPRSREAVVRNVLTKIVIDNEGCWIWQGGRSSQYQYPYTWCDGTAVAVHKLLYEYKFGELPKTSGDGTRIELHHDRHAGCKGRSSGCVNPDHLEVMSAKQHGQISAMERALGLQHPRPKNRERKKPVQSVQVDMNEHECPYVDMRVAVQDPGAA